MKTKLFDQNGKELWELDLNSSIFGLPENEGLVHRALMYQLGNERKVVAHTKTRGERRGSTRKLYRQKGTGRARAWGNRSPLRKKWGVVFGPRNNRNFQISMNKKERRKALFTLLSWKFASQQLVVVDSIQLEAMKTKYMAEVFQALPCGKNMLFALNEANEVLEKASANLPNVKSIRVNYLNVKDLLKYETLVILKDALGRFDALLK